MQLAVIERKRSEALRRRLARLPGSVPWRRLLRTMFPQPRICQTIDDFVWGQVIAWSWTWTSSNTSGVPVARIAWPTRIVARVGRASGRFVREGWDNRGFMGVGEARGGPRRAQEALGGLSQPRPAPGEPMKPLAIFDSMSVVVYPTRIIYMVVHGQSAAGLHLIPPPLHPKGMGWDGWGGGVGGRPLARRLWDGCWAALLNLAVADY